MMDEYFKLYSGQKTNRLCKAMVKNNNPKSRIVEFELVTVREYNDYNGGTYIEEIKTANDFLNNEENAYDEPYYHIYGRCEGRSIFLGEFFDIDKALGLLLDLTGEHPQLVSY